MLTADINLVDPQRFESGQWCERRQRYTGEGDIAASYSGDCIALGKPICKPFIWHGKKLVNTGCRNQGKDRLVTAFQVLHLSLFEGNTFTYAELVKDGHRARKDPMGFYHGVKVLHAGETFVLSGKPIFFAPGQTEQLSLF
ncbi:hypothetical protein [Minwuia sp.]|uniref:hypothetical protein n=1 Tax=Minwuia sp. TaxID=2493630 RepID=UPI003A8FD728